jgi:hypothetical protein
LVSNLGVIDAMSSPVTSFVLEVATRNRCLMTRKGKFYQGDVMDKHTLMHPYFSIPELHNLLRMCLRQQEARVCIGAAPFRHDVAPLSGTRRTKQHR